MHTKTAYGYTRSMITYVQNGGSNDHTGDDENHDG